MRKLASIQQIKELSPIEGADKIEVASVLGWKIVVKKDEFKVGDKVVYCEIDSLLPDKPAFEFLKPRGMRIKTIRLRGQVSQGICFPLSILPATFEVSEEIDCTEALEIIKYEPVLPAHLGGVAKGKFPLFIPKTDETRVQVLQQMLTKYQGEPCYVTEKLDGSSVTFYLRDDVFGVCSRNLELVESTDNSYWKVARALNIEEKLRSLQGNFALQGELLGEGIQGNKLKLHGQTVRFFNVYDIDKTAYLQFEQFVAFFEKLQLPTVPILFTDYPLSNDIASLVQLATRKSTLMPTAWAEGIVIRPCYAQVDYISSNTFSNGQISFKAINPEFLLNYDE